MSGSPWVPGLLVLTSFVARAGEPPDGGPERARALELFRQRVLPSLEKKCLACHGDGEELEASLDLRSREAMLRGGKSGPALVPGEPLASLIYQSVRRNDEARMPPKDRDRFSPQEVDDLKTWIRMGAPWDRAGADD